MEITSVDFCDFKNLPPVSFKLQDNLCETDLKHLLRIMVRIRVFEERLADLVIGKKITTPCHLYIGQEAVAAGVCHALKDDDYLFGTHRSHGHYLAKGGDMNSAMAEIFCRATGCSKGRGGSMHLCSPEKGILGTSSIVAGSMGIAVGTALAEQIRGTGRVTVVFHGDGVPEEGIWHEAANMANLYQLPIIFVCENNLYCTHLPLDQRRKKDNLLEVAKSHGFSCEAVDGNNVLDVYAAAQKAEKHARSGTGVFFLECRTYRWRGHVGPNDDINVGLRSQDEVDAWKERCPIKSFSNFLVSENLLSREEFDNLKNDVVNEVDISTKYATDSPYPPIESLMDNVYRESSEVAK